MSALLSRVILAAIFLAACLSPAIADTDYHMANGYTWTVRDDDPNRLYYRKGGVYLGCWSPSQETYWRWTGANWIEAEPPWGGEERKKPRPAPKPAPDPEPAPIVNFGIDLEKLKEHRETKTPGGPGATAPDAPPKYSLNGDEVSKAKAYQLIEKGLDDDSTKIRVTVLGTDAERKQIVTDLSKDAELSTWAIVREYPPDHWLITGAGFKSDAKIYCQAPSGKVLHRQDDYAGGADKAIAALRKAKKNYDSKKDPDLRKNDGLGGWSLPIIDMEKGVGYILAMIFGVIAMHIAIKKNMVAV